MRIWNVDILLCSDFLDQFIQVSFPVNVGHLKYTMEEPIVYI